MLLINTCKQTQSFSGSSFSSVLVKTENAISKQLKMQMTNIFFSFSSSFLPKMPLPIRVKSCLQAAFTSADLITSNTVQIDWAWSDWALVEVKILPGDWFTADRSVSQSVDFAAFGAQHFSFSFFMLKVGGFVIKIASSLSLSLSLSPAQQFCQQLKWRKNSGQLIGNSRTEDNKMMPSRERT